ncbi:hypothetical protein ACFX13_034981 [Malus domestica]
MFRTILGPKLYYARPTSPNLKFTDPSSLSAVINFETSFSAEITDNPDRSAGKTPSSLFSKASTKLLSAS